jgi:hypothetical protein
MLIDNGVRNPVRGLFLLHLMGWHDYSIARIIVLCGDLFAASPKIVNRVIIIGDGLWSFGYRKK